MLDPEAHKEAKERFPLSYAQWKLGARWVVPSIPGEESLPKIPRGLFLLDRVNKRRKWATRFFYGQASFKLRIAGLPEAVYFGEPVQDLLIVLPEER